MPATRGARIAVLLSTLALIGAAVIWWQWPDAPATLATSPVVVADIEDTVVATGTIEAAKLVSVGAQASGQIKSLRVAAGDQVKAGDLIAEIDATTQQNSERNAQAAVATARAQRVAQSASLRVAELAFKRQQTMLASEATSRAEFEGAEAALTSARAQIKVADAQIVQSETALATATANLGYTRIVAPIDGTVVAVVAKSATTRRWMRPNRPSPVC
jgi:membrane fusion protein, macrolide-specific efflux system